MAIYRRNYKTFRQLISLNICCIFKQNSSSSQIEETAMMQNSFEKLLIIITSAMWFLFRYKVLVNYKWSYSSQHKVLRTLCYRFVNLCIFCVYSLFHENNMHCFFCNLSKIFEKTRKNKKIYKNH